MPTVSEQLRRAREDQHLDIYQVAEITKIRTDHIRALESGNFDMFSAPVYIRGFVRTYGTMLKLDVPRLIADLETELGQTQKFAAPPPLTNEPRGPLDFLMLQLSRLNWRIVLVAVAIAVFLLVGASLIRGRSGRAAGALPDLGPALYQPRGEQSGETLPLPGSTNR